jgi:hypothetical protein
MPGSNPGVPTKRRFADLRDRRLRRTGGRLARTRSTVRLITQIRFAARAS